MKQVVKCLITNEKNEILLIQRADDDDHGGSWETPGGGIDDFETPTQACIREVKEEAGCDIEQVELIADIIIPDSETGEMFEVDLFSAKLVNGSLPNLENNPDHQDFIWIKVEDIKNNDKILIDSWTEEQLCLQTSYEK